jgi:hypothetical protein
MSELLEPDQNESNEPVLTAVERLRLLAVRNCVEFVEERAIEEDDPTQARLEFQRWRKEHGHFDDDMGTGEES